MLRLTSLSLRPTSLLSCCYSLLLVDMAAAATKRPKTDPPASDGYYRHDGVRITHDPYAAGMAAKYGTPGKTDNEGFDPYADSVGAGIYSGTVQRDARGVVVIGQQYQNHNSKPGPVYAGGGYTPVSMAVGRFLSDQKGGGGGGGGGDSSALGRLLTAHPDLVNDVSTGGALPLHTCGMSGDNQHATSFLISRGADIEALDTYGFTPLHRMASNNLAAGATALLAAGADPLGLSKAKVAGLDGTSTPMQVAKESRAKDVIAVLKKFGEARRTGPATAVRSVEVLSAGYAPIIGRFEPMDGAAVVPVGFEKVCVESGWDTPSMWAKLNGGEGLVWFKHTENESYLYFNKMDSMWWIDGPNGLGAYKASGPPWAPPGSSTAWENLLGGDDANAALPVLSIHRGGTGAAFGGGGAAEEL